MAGIATYYRGIEYRSRLGARWASFMHAIGWDITYEPFDGNGYIPVCLVAGPLPMLVEVKPAVTLGEYRAAIPKSESGLRGLWQHDILIVGASPLPSITTDMSKLYGYPVAGLLGQNMSPYYDIDDMVWDFEAANWAHRCEHGITVQHIYQSFESRPCGCYDGSQYGANRRIIEEHWAESCNDVKWRGRAAAC